MSEPAHSDDQAAEIAALRAEVAALRAELEADLAVKLGEDVWRLRRLAELGVAQAKINHDLRNLMTSALMVADRLQGSGDAKIARSGTMLVTAIEQATALIATTLNFTAEAAPLPSRSRFRLAALIADIAEELRAEHDGFAIENAAPADLHLEADRALFARAIGHLLRTAAKAQARQAVVHVEQAETSLAIVLTDDGRPFREDVSAAFRPFSGAFRYGSTGLGFVIARDLIEAHGGSILIRTGSGDGRTCIVLRLPVPD
jgi:signal transduction histidine kinase